MILFIHNYSTPKNIYNRKEEVNNMKAMIIVNNGLEECEALITYDLLYRAGIKTDLVGFTDEILSSHEVRFKAHRLLDEIDPAEYDCLILPGGMPGTKNLENDERVQKLIDDFVKENKLIAAICAAPMVLGKLGILKGKQATCYPGCQEPLGESYVGGLVVESKNIITAKGPGLSADFAFCIIERLASSEVADAVYDAAQY